MKAATTVMTNSSNSRSRSSNTDALGIKEDHPQAVIMDEGYVTQSRNTSISSTGEYCSTAVSTDIEDVTSMADPDIWSTTLQQNIGSANNIHPLDPTSLMMSNWESQIFTTDDLKTQLWEDLTFPQQQTELPPQQSQQQQAIRDNGIDKNYTFHQIVCDTPIYNNDFMLQQMNPFAYNNNSNTNNNAMFNEALYHSAPPTASTTPNGSGSGGSSSSSGLITPPMTSYFQQRSSLPTSNKRLLYMNNTALDMTPRRSSAGDTRHHGMHAHPRLGRRASSNPSVASVVSLTAHEPISKIVDGIEYITFLYSHDRLVKEYTVRTDVDHVNLDDIVMDFRIQNAIYPRANVDRSEYDGNRWDYETTCNQLGWKLCWLNKEQLFGRRGLIQRAVDSYRNRHAEMRSRRVTRQEKVANGTLRKRRSKKSLTML